MQYIQPDRPKVGLALFVLDEEFRFLIGERKKEGLFGLVGGHLEKFETMEGSLAREAEEEANLKFEEKDLIFFDLLNVFRKEANYHYLDVVYVCKFPKEQKVINMEPDKCKDWIWMSCEELFAFPQEKLFYPMIDIIIKYKSAENLKAAFSEKLK